MRVPGSLALWLAAALALLALAALLLLLRSLRKFEPPFDNARLALTDPPLRGAALSEPLEPPSTLRAFYSGHSLSDGVPEEVQRIAASRGRSLEFEFQSLEGSLIRQRTKGEDPQATAWPGFRAGKNRSGEGLDVEAALRGTLPAPFGAPAPPYEVLVVTERHDLPYAVREEHTVRYLRLLHDRLIEGNRRAQTLLYHSWLEIDPAQPERFIDYERKALVLWECVASAVNRQLRESGRPDRIRVLPGGTALAELIERLARGDVTGAPGANASERIQALFRDRVHLTELGRYFMGAVHYAALFRESPEGAAIPRGISPSFGLELQRSAWQHVRAYTARAAAAAERSLDVCASYSAQVLCPLFNAHPRSRGRENLITRTRRDLRCRQGFSDTSDPDHPLR